MTNLSSSLLLAPLFEFKKNQTLLTSLNSLSPSMLQQLAQHPVGSHVFDGFFSSKTVQTQTKVGLFEKLDVSVADQK